VRIISLSRKESAVSEPHQWIHQVFTVGSALRGIKDDELAQILNRMAEDGWDIINVTIPYGGRPKIIARRLLSGAERRQKSWPG
jgi:hypothetical protein